ncbi:hypothetical protein CMI42_05355 [Candidatus Pacearchaeota archaeon]|nr:hypothetical protein [Candidatus Pacearchaeota archaeon]
MQVARKLDQMVEKIIGRNTLGFSIDPRSRRIWGEVQDGGVYREIRVFSIDEAMSENEAPVDGHNRRGRRVPYFIDHEVFSEKFKY